MMTNKTALHLKILIVLVLHCIGFTAHAQYLRKRTTMLMGSKFEITIVAADSALAEQHIDSVIAEVTRIENLISDWIPASQVSAVNSNAGLRPVKVDPEVYELTKRAIRISEVTGGAFDISFAAMEKVWKFDGSMTAVPSAEDVRKSVAKVGYKNILLDSVHCTIFLRLPGMKIGFGSIGKGYAADRGRQIMLAKGIKSGIVNASGDMRAWGRQPDGTDWKIGITNPFKPGKVMTVVPLRDGAVVTSGNYENYIVLQGKRYSHIINPATGYPAEGLASVTVFGPDAEMANGLSTSIIVLGKDSGLKLVKQYPGFKVIMITDQGKVIRSAR